MNEKSSKFSWWDKLKKIKHIEIYIAIIFIVILLLIYLSNFSSNKSSSGTKTTTVNELSITGYVQSLEDNLQDILSNIGGVSNVKVMITLDMSTSTITDQQLTLTVMPPIKGVLVTANGVEDVGVKVKVLHAIEAVLDVKNGNVQILSSN